MKMYSPQEIVKAGMCIGCGICVTVAQRKNAHIYMQFDKWGFLKPTGPLEWQNKLSEDFSNLCPFSPEALNEDDISARLFNDTNIKRHTAIGSYISTYVGHVSDETTRMNGSSGGLVSWVAAELLKQKLIDGVAHVVAVENPQHEGRFFKYRISRTTGEIYKGAKSRYYPVELSEVLTTIQEVPGKYAVIGIPCMIKGIQLLRHNNPLFRLRIAYTLGLFCGHMKSALFVESFAWQMKVPFKQIKKLDFRYKIPNRPANWYQIMLQTTEKQYHKDWWHLKDGDWGAGFFMNPACNFCDDVVAETADISFGDAWVEPYTSDGKGNNVVIVRNHVLNEILENGKKLQNLKLGEVSASFVAETQAAGLRHRREGLAFRLEKFSPKIIPFKRVLPGSANLSNNRKIVYWMRFRIAICSNRIFWIARTLHFPFFYLFWARLATSVYYGFTYKKGSVREMINRFFEFSK